MSNVSFTGNIGKSHGLKYSNDGKPRLSFSAAETARIKDQGGNWIDGGTTWFNVTLFGNAAEAIDAQIVSQGGKGKVIVTGRMSTREYEHNNEKRESLDVVADSVGFVPRTPQNPTQQARQPAQGQQQGTQGGDNWNRAGVAPVAAQVGWGGQPQQSGGWGQGGADQAVPF